MADQKYSQFYNTTYDDGPYKVNVPKSKRTNHLLVNPSLAKVKHTTWSLPPQEHTYGYCDPIDMENAGDLLTYWAVHQPNAQNMPGRDFVQLNKYATMNGCVNAKNVSAFRSNNDIRIEESQAQDYGTFYPTDDTVFGRPSAPSASIQALMSNKYQRNAIEQRRTMASTRRTVARDRRTRNTMSAKMTRAALGHSKVSAAPPQKAFKMKQFQNVPSRVSQQMYANTRPVRAGRRANSAGAVTQQAPEQAMQAQQEQY